MTQEQSPRPLFFRERLGTLLAERGISQRQLAEATKLTPQSISNYVRGTRNLPRAEELYALAQYFGVSMESFLAPHSEQAVAESKRMATSATPTQAKLRRIAKQIEHISKELDARAKELVD